MDNINKFKKGIQLEPTTDSPTEKGDLVSDSATGKLEYHNGSSESPLVTEGHTATLTNKTLTSPTLNTPTLNGSGGQLTLPAGPDILVGRATTDTLTNKSISGSTNTLSNIPNAATTATSANTNSAIVARDGSGNFSAGTITANLTGNVTGNADTATTASNVSGTVAIANGGTGQTSKTAAFDALSPTTTKGDIIVSDGSDNIRLAVGSFGQALTADSSQTSGLKWSTIPQGVKNYITTNAGIEQGSTTGYSLGNASLTNAFPSGAPTFGSGASGNLSLTTVSSGQLAGSYSLSLVSSAATTAGNLLATDTFTIDKEDQAKVLQFKFYYSAASNPGNANWSGTSSNSFGVAIYDVTNTSWIQPAGVYNLVQSSGVGLCTGTFQTASNASSLRLVLFNANATSGAITLYLDDFFCGPQITAAGAAISDWESFTPTSTFVSNATHTGKKRMVGDTQEVEVYVSFSGATTATTFTLTLPSTLDTTKIASGSATAETSTLGIAKLYDSSLSADGYLPGQVYAASSTTVRLMFPPSTSNPTGTNGMNVMTNTIPTTIGSSSKLTIKFSYPVAGKSSNTVMSNDTDTRVVGFTSNRTSGNRQSISNATENTFAPQVTAFDTHSGYNSSTGEYTVPVSGLYSVSAGIYFVSLTANTGQVVCYMKINGGTGGGSSNISCAQSIGASTEESANINGVVQCNAGDKITIIAYQNNGGSRNCSGYISISRLSGPATIAATETVSARYYQSATTAQSTYLDFPTKDYDTHNAVTTGSGTFKFTVPVSGIYLITLLYSGVAGANIKLHKGGSDYINAASAFILNADPTNGVANGSITARVNAGDILQLQTSNNGGMSGHCSFTRIGN